MAQIKKFRNFKKRFLRNQCEEYSLVESVLNKNVGIDSRPAVRSKRKRRKFSPRKLQRKEGSFHHGSFTAKTLEFSVLLHTGVTCLIKTQVHHRSFSKFFFMR